jgi:hypothetical protein
MVPGVTLLDDNTYSIPLATTSTHISIKFMDFYTW